MSRGPMASAVTATPMTPTCQVQPFPAQICTTPTIQEFLWISHYRILRKSEEKCSNCGQSVWSWQSLSRFCSTNCWRNYNTDMVSTYGAHNDAFELKVLVTSYLRTRHDEDSHSRARSRQEWVSCPAITHTGGTQDELSCPASVHLF